MADSKFLKQAEATAQVTLTSQVPFSFDSLLSRMSGYPTTISQIKHKIRVDDEADKESIKTQQRGNYKLTEKNQSCLAQQQ
jgi:hypothetical protein